MRPEDARRDAWRRVLLALMLFGAMALVYLVYNVSRFERLSDINAMDYAQIARHVARGEGFTTSFIKPLSLVHVRRVQRHPDLTYPPLHILWTAGMLKLLGATDRAVSHASGFAFVLTIPLVFWLALRMFDWRTAVLATTLCGTHITLLRYAVSGLEASLLGLLVTALILVLYTLTTTEKRELAWVAAAGVLMGLVYLTKYIWIVAALPVIVFLSLVRPERRWLRVGVFVLLIIVIAAPWLYRNWAITGNPFFTLRTYEMFGQTRAHPANTIYRTFRDHYQSYLSFAVSNPRAIFEKVRQGMTTFYASFPSMLGVFVTPFFIVAIMVRLGVPAVERLRLLIYALLIVVAFALSFVIAAPRLLSPLAPTMIVIATAFFWRLLDARTSNLDERTRGRWVTFAVALLVLLQIHPFITAVTPDIPYERIGDTPLEIAATQVNHLTEGPVLTDVPWVVAWRADRDAIWVPQTQTDLRKMEEAVGRFRWLFLSPEIVRMATPEHLTMWANVWLRAQREDVGYLGFVVSARLGDGGWILMERRPGD